MQHKIFFYKKEKKLSGGSPVNSGVGGWVGWCWVGLGGVGWG